MSHEVAKKLKKKASPMKRVAALLTCHNRRDKTIACLDALFRNELPDGYELSVILVDDGSVDGTATAVLERYPQVELIKGNGKLYWNGGMRVAFAAAMENCFDFYLWLNDDTVLYPSALKNAITTAAELKAQLAKDVIVVGATRDASSGQLTYGGVVRTSKWKPLAFKLVAPADVALECKTMNGNCVLVPDAIAQAIGGMEPAFAHAMGDLDYGLRAQYAGFRVWLMPGFAGVCSKNSVTGSFNDAALPMSARLRQMWQPKGLPISSWRVFTQRHAGILWPLYWLWPYAKTLIKGMFKK